MKALRHALLLLLCMILLVLAGCGERYDLLYSLEDGGLTYVVRGTGDRAKQVVVKLDDHIVWTHSIHGNRKVGNHRNVYGVEFMDLDFDGTRDIVITKSVQKDLADVECYLWNQEKNRFVLSEQLSSLNNVMSDPENECIFAYEYIVKTYDATADRPSTYVLTDRVTKYLWSEGALLPDRRASVSYHSEQNLYLYAVENYDPKSNVWEEDNEWYYSPEEFSQMDFSFFYYYK